MASNLQDCERELETLLAKIDNTRDCLVTAIQAIKKAKEAMKDIPSQCLSDKLRSLLSLVSQEIGYVKVVDVAAVEEQVSAVAQNKDAESTSNPTDTFPEVDKDAMVAPPSIPQLDSGTVKSTAYEVKEATPPASPEQNLSEGKLEDLPLWNEVEGLTVMATSSLMPGGHFWCKPQTAMQQKDYLKEISVQLRKHTMSNRDLWNCDANNMDQMVCVLSKTHNLWLRAFIEKQLSEKELILRYIDIGKSEKMQRSRLNCVPKELTSLQSLALNCCFQSEPLKVSYEMKWRFSDLTKKPLTLSVKSMTGNHQTQDSFSPRYIVSLKTLDDPPVDVGEVICGQFVADSEKTDTSIPFKDVRLMSGTAGNISHIRDIHNAKDDGKKDKDVTENGLSIDIGGIDFSKLEDEEKVEWGEVCQTPNIEDEKNMEILPLKEFQDKSKDVESILISDAESFGDGEADLVEGCVGGKETGEKSNGGGAEKVPGALLAENERERNSEIKHDATSEDGIVRGYVADKNEDVGLNSEADLAEAEPDVEGDVKRASELIIQQRLECLSKSSDGMTRSSLSEDQDYSGVESENMDSVEEMVWRVPGASIAGADVGKSEKVTKSAGADRKVGRESGKPSGQTGLVNASPIWLYDGLPSDERRDTSHANIKNPENVVELESGSQKKTRTAGSAKSTGGDIKKRQKKTESENSGKKSPSLPHSVNVAKSEKSLPLSSDANKSEQVKKPVNALEGDAIATSNSSVEKSNVSGTTVISDARSDIRRGSRDRKLSNSSNPSPQTVEISDEVSKTRSLKNRSHTKSPIVVNSSVVSQKVTKQDVTKTQHAGKAAKRNSPVFHNASMVDTKEEVKSKESRRAVKAAKRNSPVFQNAGMVDTQEEAKSKESRRSGKAVKRNSPVLQNSSMGDTQEEAKTDVSKTGYLGSDEVEKSSSNEQLNRKQSQIKTSNNKTHKPGDVGENGPEKTEEKDSEKKKLPNNLSVRDQWLNRQLNGLSHPDLVNSNAKYFSFILTCRMLKKAFETQRTKVTHSKDFDDAIKEYRKCPVVILFFTNNSEKLSGSTASRREMWISAVGIVRSEKNNFKFMRDGVWRETCVVEIEFVCRAKAQNSILSSYVDGAEMKRKEAYRRLTELDGWIRKGMVVDDVQSSTPQQQQLLQQQQQRSSVVHSSRNKQAPWLRYQPPRQSRNSSNESSNQEQQSNNTDHQTESPKEPLTIPTPALATPDNSVFSIPVSEEVWSPVEPEPPAFPGPGEAKAQGSRFDATESLEREVESIMTQENDQPIARKKIESPNASWDDNQQEIGQPISRQENCMKISVSRGSQQNVGGEIREINARQKKRLPSQEYYQPIRNNGAFQPITSQAKVSAVASHGASQPISRQDQPIPSHEGYQPMTTLPDSDQPMARQENCQQGYYSPVSPQDNQTMTRQQIHQRTPSQEYYPPMPKQEGQPITTPQTGQLPIQQGIPVLQGFPLSQNPNQQSIIQQQQQKQAQLQQQQQQLQKQQLQQQQQQQLQNLQLQQQQQHDMYLQHQQQHNSISQLPDMSREEMIQMLQFYQMQAMPPQMRMQQPVFHMQQGFNKSPGGFQPFAPAQQQQYMDAQGQLMDRGTNSSNMTAMFSSSEDFGSDDEAERDIRKDCEIFGLSQDDV